MTLQETIVEYLGSKDWYFDKDRAAAFEWMDEKDLIRQAPAWTVPQWGEYWEVSSKRGNSPRRWEDLKDALWSQILREEKPEQFETFFQAKDTE